MLSDDNEKLEQRIERVRGLLEKATPRPWRASDSHGLCIYSPKTMVADMDPDSTPRGSEWHGRLVDADLIAEAVNILPALLEDRARLQAATVSLETRQAIWRDEARAEITRLQTALDEAARHANGLTARVRELEAFVRAYADDAARGREAQAADDPRLGGIRLEPSEMEYMAHKLLRGTP